MCFELYQRAIWTFLFEFEICLKMRFCSRFIPMWMVMAAADDYLDDQYDAYILHWLPSMDFTVFAVKQRLFLLVMLSYPIYGH